MKILKYLAPVLLGAALLQGCAKEEWPAQPDWSKIPNKSEEPVDDGTIKPLKADNIVVAHRGGSAESGFPDNSIAGLKYCIENRIYGCECDAYITSDNQVIIAHSTSTYTVNGLTPWDHTLAEIRKAGVLTNGEQIPTLEEFLDVAVDPKSCTKIFIELKKLDANHLNYIISCAKRVSEIVREKKAQHFVTFLCTGTNDNVMKSAKSYADAVGCDYQVNTGKNIKQLQGLGLSWGNYPSGYLTSEFGGTGSINPRDYAAAKMSISMYFLDKKKYNEYSITDASMLDFYIANLGIFRTICSNYPVWLAGIIEEATKTYDGISNLKDFQAFAKALAVDPTAKNFQNAEGVVVLKNDIKLDVLSPLPAFEGKFDGGGKTITYNYTGSANTVGLFQSLKGSVSNLKLAGSIKHAGNDGTTYIGALAATTDGATVTGCTTNVNISYEGAGSCQMGGFIGATTKAGGKLIFSGSNSRGDIKIVSSNTTTASHVGGFVGVAQNSNYLLSSEYGLEFLDCEYDATMDLEGTSGCRGAGYAATVNVDMHAKNCKVAGAINIGKSDIERICAGITAYQTKNACNCLVEGCTLSAKIKHIAAGGGNAWVGGLIGTGFHANAVISGCKSTKDAYVGSLKTGSVGMMAGRPNYAITVKNCKIAGTINKVGEETVISASTIEDWMFKGSATAAAVVLEGNGFNAE